MKPLPRWTLGARLWGIVVLSTLTLITIIVVDVVSTQAVRRDLRRIEDNYVPLLDLGPKVSDAFIAVSRSLQEATAAQDLAARDATRAQKDQLIALLNHVPPSVRRSAVISLKADIEAWYETAYDVSTRLIRGRTGEHLTDEVRTLQAERARVLRDIQGALTLDRGRLAGAFDSARSVETSAAWVRTAIPAGLTALLAILALGISRRVARSLNAFADGFERFGRGDFSEPIRVPGGDELAQAAGHANRMARNLEELDEQLRGRQAELERANQELEAFSYSVSHDLRAPLRSIDGFSQALLEDFGELLPEEGKDDLSRVRAAAQRMAQLIDDILRLSRVSRAELHLDRVDLSAIAREVGAELSREHPSAREAVVVSEGMVVMGDAQLLRIVLENLLGNAVKFTSQVDHPHIEVGTSVLRGERVFWVSDNGVGFDMKYAGKLFAPFQRLHSATQFPGTGIGLATVQRIIHRHGGRAWAESALGRGTTIFFTIPPPGIFPGERA